MKWCSLKLDLCRFRRAAQAVRSNDVRAAPSGARKRLTDNPGT